MKKIILTALMLALFNGIIGARADQSITLAWNPSTNTNVAGYMLYCDNGVATNRIDAGTSTNRTVTGLNEGDAYKFTVTAYDADHNESPASNPIEYRVPDSPSNAVTNALNGIALNASSSMPTGITATSALQIAPSLTTTGASRMPSLSFPVTSGHEYAIQASTDLKAWTTIWQTNSSSDSVIRFTDPDSVDFKMRFYRTVSY